MANTAPKVSSSSEPIEVGLGSRSYKIHIGQNLLAKAGALIVPHLRRPKVTIVTDENVASLHLEAFQNALRASSVVHETIILPPGEQTKSFANLETLLDRLLELAVERQDTIIAFGGGVIGDLTGFAASILRRGVDFIQVPTTLLSQVDSSVGGKTGINSRFGKNLIGSFYQPKLVICDVDVLGTLPEREFKAGYAEVVKYGLIYDASFFDWLTEKAGSVTPSHPSNLVQAVRRSCEIKSQVVAQDEREAGIRAILNFGHTFGHALEAYTNYGPDLIHGEAVAIGMALASSFSAELGLCSQEDAKSVRTHLEMLGIKNSLADMPETALSAEALLGHMYQDKKVEGDQLTFILMKRIGETVIDKSTEADKVRRFLERKIKEACPQHP